MSIHRLTTICVKNTTESFIILLLVRLTLDVVHCATTPINICFNNLTFASNTRTVKKISQSSTAN